MWLLNRTPASLLLGLMEREAIGMAATQEQQTKIPYKCSFVLVQNVCVSLWDWSQIVNDESSFLHLT